MGAEQFAVGVLAGFCGVGQREIEGVRREQGIPLALRVGAITGPAVVGGVFDHAGADRVEFDVALAGEQPGVLLDQTGAVAPFPETAAAPVGPVDVLHIALAQAFHHDAGRFGVV